MFIQTILQYCTDIEILHCKINKSVFVIPFFIQYAVESLWQSKGRWKKQGKQANVGDSIHKQTNDGEVKWWIDISYKDDGVYGHSKTKCYSQDVGEYQYIISSKFPLS